MLTMTANTSFSPLLNYWKSFALNLPGPVPGAAMTTAWLKVNMDL